MMHQYLETAYPTKWVIDSFELVRACFLCSSSTTLHMVPFHLNVEIPRQSGTIKLLPLPPLLFVISWHWCIVGEISQIGSTVAVQQWLMRIGVMMTVHWVAAFCCAWSYIALAPALTSLKIPWWWQASIISHWKTKPRVIFGNWFQMKCCIFSAYILSCIYYTSVVKWFKFSNCH